MPSWVQDNLIKKIVLLRGLLTKIVLLLLICITIMGCNSEIKTIESPVSLPDEFSATGSEVLPHKWWQSFNDPQLDKLIEQALGSNFSIRSTWDRLTQAEQIAIKTGTSLFPEIDYKAEAKRTRQEASNVKTYSSNYTASLVLSYEIDFWGKIRSSDQAALLDAEAARENVYTAAITLSANVARTWYQLAEAKQQTSVLNKQLTTNQKVLEIITNQFRKGQVGAADVFRQKQLVESTQGKLIQARESVVLLQHQLSVLIGKKPELRWDDDNIELVELPAFPETGLPSSTIQNRPDVLRAFRTIQAADMRVAVAVADQYPTISIFSTTETFSSKVHDLFDDWLANLVVNATGPLFDAGLRKAEVKRTQAVLSETINDYGQTILEAIQEIEDAINQEYYQQKYVESLNKQLQLARQVSERTEQSYIKGTLDYLRVLEVLVSQQNLEINELTARRILVERRIDLCKAIAGSWEMQQPEQATISKIKNTSL
jgi:NodT family efflux transporter outer membrane factor (OMF) lipoprotein